MKYLATYFLVIIGLAVLWFYGGNIASSLFVGFSIVFQFLVYVAIAVIAVIAVIYSIKKKA